MAGSSLTPAPRSSAAPRRLAALVAAVEALAAAVGAAAVAVSGARSGDEALLLGTAVGLLGAAVAALLVAMSVAFTRGRRWPTGGFVTVQVLALVIAVSVGGPSLLALGEGTRPAVATAAVLVVAGLGLLGVRPAGRPDPEV